MTVHINPDRAAGSDWEAFFDDAFREATADERYSLPPEGFEFAHVAWPLVERSANPVAERMTRLAQGGIVDPERLAVTYADMVAPLWKSVFSAVSRFIVLEFAAAQSTGLLGPDGKDRYSVFADCLQDADFAEGLLRRNPALCELTSVICRNWRDASVEFLERLHTDWEHLKDRYCGGAADTIVAIHSSLGDPHRQGRTVKIIEFSGGQKLVYKPRSLAADLHFRDFASWFNTAAGCEMMRSVDVLDMGSHGWCEHIDHLPVSNADDLAAYFTRLGALMAVARILGLTDLHSENLIAHGGWPVIVDLETLFHPLASDLRPDDADSPAAKTLRRVHDISVAATGLLPIRSMLSQGPDKSIDLAGMSDTQGQETPFAVPMWHNAGSDGMRLVEDRQTLRGDANVPVLDGQRISPEPYLEQVLDGFRSAYAILQANWEILSSANGPVAAFCDDPIRVVVRATQSYLFLLADRSHPDLLEGQEKMDDWFCEALKEANASPVLPSLQPCEINALRRNDVPYFETTVDSHDIMSCDGGRYEGLLPQSGLAIARSIVAELGPADLEQQCWLIKVALTKASVATQSHRPLAGIISEQYSNLNLEEKALLIARRAAEQVSDSAIWKDGHAAWFTVQEARDDALSAQAAGLDLYSGLPGIALFLSQAGRHLNDSRLQKMGEAGWRELLSVLQTRDHADMPVGGFSGLGGLLFALQVLASEQSGLGSDSAVERLVNGFDHSRLDDAPMELVDGLAGLLLASLPLRSGGPVRASICRAIIKRLELAADKGEANGQLLSRTGMAHGVDGLRFALSRLAQSEDRGMHSSACNALRLLDRVAGRGSGDQAECRHEGSIAWCNGLAGRLIARDEFRPDGTETDAIALMAKLDTDEHLDDSLCHGTMGALLALQSVAPSLSSDCRGKAAERTDAWLTRMLRDGARCGTINGVFSPGLMDGMSGIGMAALGIADPHSTPMILKLAFGPAASASGGMSG